MPCLGILTAYRMLLKSSNVLAGSGSMIYVWPDLIKKLHVCRLVSASKRDTYIESGQVFSKL